MIDPFTTSPFMLATCEGYTQAEMDALNAEWAARAAEFGPDDIEARNEALKAFCDEVAQR
jgi:hypothetical protein